MKFENFYFIVVLFVVNTNCDDGNDIIEGPNRYYINMDRVSDSSSCPRTVSINT